MDFCQLKKIGGGEKKSIVHSCDSTIDFYIDFGILKIKTIKFYRAEREAT